MPAPGPHPHPDEIHCDARQDPPVVGGLDGLPEIAQIQFAERPPQENCADQNTNPELPSFHKHIVPEVSDEPKEPKEKTGSFDFSGAL